MARSEKKEKRFRFFEKRSSQRVVFKNSGYCPICAKQVKFIATDHWFRDYYLCQSCHSIPRERALMYVIQTYFPQWQELVIHESSPLNRGTSQRLALECNGYIPSHYYPDGKPGGIVNGFRCENLEALTFPNESIDLHITQDVMEHVFSPSKAFQEIKRTLRPGGAHIFTVPLVNKNAPSKMRAKLSDNGEIICTEPPIYHGNPINEKGSLVVTDWGFDICEKIFEASGLFTHMIYIDNLSMGIRAELIEVLVTFKPSKSVTSDSPISSTWK